MIAPVYSTYVETEARKLLGNRHQWSWARNKETGVSFVAVPSGEKVYHVHPLGRGCDCEATQVWRAAMCKHRLAVIRANEDDQNAEIDQAIAETFVEMSWDQFRASLPGCAGGCGAITEGPAFCDNCSAARARAERLAAGRAKVLAEWTS